MIVDVMAKFDGRWTEAPLLSGDGVYWFPVPRDVYGDFTFEVWATDDAGNVGYAVAILSIEGGSIKCIRWLNGSNRCTMLAHPRPWCEDATLRPIATMELSRAVSDTIPRALCGWVSVRPTAVMLPHECGRC